MKTHAWIASLLLAVAGCGNATTTDGLDASVPGSCTSDSQCRAPTPRCDLNAAKCVACLPTNDNCPKGQRCVAMNGTYACSSSCLSDADCPRSDAGSQLVCCTGACIDTSSDISSCGRCGTACLAPANATAGCSGGMCGVGQCNLGFLDCDRAANNGCETNASVDTKNCGACGKVCTAGANQTGACENGACTATCVQGFADCDGKPENGCEVNLQTDGTNCGACGKACTLPNANSVCKAGACVVNTCAAGFDDCDQMPVNGCESDLQADVNHCGSCIGVCTVANGVPACASGLCRIGSCDVGFADCDNLYLTGCEINVASDIKNCGKCGIKCQGPNSMQQCGLGACQITLCAADYADCDRKPETGCEINVATDLANCGGCGNACPIPANASATCANATCGIGQCKFGFADCNKDVKDGCEVDLLTVQNCGACGIACQAPANATPGCKVGVCGIGMCNALFGDCDGNAQNGCEKNLATDAMNCGKCGSLCAYPNAQAACLGGQCGILACNQGFDDCDKIIANGCEVNLGIDVKNCGACGNACQNPLVCMGGQCVNMPKVAIVYADPYSADVKRLLVNTGAFSVVDEINAQNSTPTLQQLQAYSAVLVYSLNTFFNSTALGDVLADYWDAGGYVVIATFANTTYAPLQGRFGTVGNGYMLINPAGSYETSADSLGAVAEPNSPLMTGVAALSATAAYRSAGGVVNGGVVVASYKGARPLIVRGVVKGRNMAALNLWPVSSVGYYSAFTGDLDKLLRNALLYR